MSAFHLSEENDSFKCRSNGVFSQLDDIKNNLALNKDTIKPAPRKRKVNSSAEKQGSESTSAKPGHESQPEKWRKYNLEETNLSNDRENTCAAFAFLHDIEMRSKVENSDHTKAVKKDEEAHVKVSQDEEVLPEEHSQDLQSGQGVICFKKPSVYKMAKHEVGKPSSRSSKLFSAHGNIAKTSFDKVELDHLDENLSAVEYQAEIAAKLEETIKLRKTTTGNMTDSTTSDSFKTSLKPHKGRRNVRKRNESGEDNAD